MNEEKKESIFESIINDKRINEYILIRDEDFMKLCDNLKNKNKELKIIDNTSDIEIIIFSILFFFLYGITPIEQYNLFDFNFVQNPIPRKKRSENNVNEISNIRPSNDKIRNEFSKRINKYVELINKYSNEIQSNKIKEEIVIKFFFNNKAYYFNFLINNLNQIYLIEDKTNFNNITHYDVNKSSENDFFSKFMIFHSYLKSNILNKSFSIINLLNCSCFFYNNYSYIYDMENDDLKKMKEILENNKIELKRKNLFKKISNKEMLELHEGIFNNNYNCFELNEKYK